MHLPKPALDAKLLPILMVIITVSIVVVALVPYGKLRQTYDSRDLMSASESLNMYLIGKNSDGHSYLVRAPLHPFILSFFDNKEVALWWINLLCLSGSATLLYILCSTIRFSELTSAVIAVAAITFYPWLMNFQFFWTEPLFIFFILCLTLSLVRNYSLTVILGLCALLFLTRKAGIFFFISAAVFYAMDRKFANAAIVFCASIVVFGCWQWIEYFYGSTGSFGVMLGTLDEYDRIHYLDAITSWFLPIAIPLLLRALLFVTIFLAGFFYFRVEIFSFFQVRQNLVLLAVAGIYSTLFISFSGASGYEDAERYLNVVFPLWIMLLTGIGRKIYPTVSRSAGVAIALTVCLWFLYSFSRTVHHLF